MPCQTHCDTEKKQLKHSQNTTKDFPEGERAQSSLCIGNMSNGENVSRSGSKDQSQPEIADAPSVSESVHLKCSGFLLTVENVKKLQEEYPTTKSILTRQSIEAYINQSNLFLNENETSTEENETISIDYHGEDTCDDHRENIEETLKKDLQTRSLPSSVHEYQSSKKHEVADVETQTEWSYSDRSVDSTEQKSKQASYRSKARKKQDQRSLIVKEKYEGVERDGYKNEILRSTKNYLNNT
ncbi:uncharacterized protein LOC121927159 isoform X2 [Sceloporus undulatus]|uniref:uncharacterized protein LOC121927159 isoform X2 n=1 Tax=Sceloporus undulatus TaxID=8520 RepID=UPI001C4D2A41|nr:uncharacterized protein LOC121927159 isoform X2 [Sceloporus undulatus]XP_042316701.1 uncharacterized protein LOC121927159 isoform X2 [Sceloporus undulatus]XP_042316702.1 uncharacterized protein LOC121927159 isoform X2 [Sceloporus undulatus]XP_042316703.1 uncharacterized protein LOC121927159 isoform X2 [Sceloporus undulatus]XP_042316704.1 uncharacterized protein LOC121927159 isoform X2 [Sceloporus undulatus]XP_042316705.1 uncharacterized protein LOC121927159 isoform X2 [Sceloporus undulatus]